MVRPGDLVDVIAADAQAGQATVVAAGARVVILEGERERRPTDGIAARTDLLTPELTQPLAHDLYHTIHHKLLKLPDELEVFPTHGAGSYCVAPVSKERTTTIGRERANNSLAQARSVPFSSCACGSAGTCREGAAY